MKRFRSLFALAALVAVGMTTQSNVSVASNQVARPECLCLDVWDPVCTYDGKTFSNGCYAACAGYGPDEYYDCGGPVEL